jgi:hypothetical protein
LVIVLSLLEEKNGSTIQKRKTHEKSFSTLRRGGRRGAEKIAL